MSPSSPPFPVTESEFIQMSEWVNEWMSEWVYLKRFCKWTFDFYFTKKTKAKVKWHSIMISMTFVNGCNWTIKLFMQLIVSENYDSIQFSARTICLNNNIKFQYEITENHEELMVKCVLAPLGSDCTLLSINSFCTQFASKLAA